MQLTFYKHQKDVIVRPLNKMQINFYEITLVLRGSLRYEINDTPITLNDTDAIFLRPNDFRKRKGNVETADYISIHFLSDTPVDLPTKLRGAIRSGVPALLMCMDKIGEDLQPNAQLASTYALQCLLEYIRCNLYKKNELPVIANAKAYMHANLNKKITIDEVATHLNFSSSYVTALFRKATGYPILTYLTQLRMEEAKRLLLSDEYALQEISQMLGFENYNYFSRFFKKHAGLPPSDYKQKFLIQADE